MNIAVLLLTTLNESGQFSSTCFLFEFSFRVKSNEISDKHGSSVLAFSFIQFKPLQKTLLNFINDELIKLLILEYEGCDHCVDIHFVVKVKV